MSETKKDQRKRALEQLALALERLGPCSTSADYPQCFTHAGWHPGLPCPVAAAWRAYVDLGGELPQTESWETQRDRIYQAGWDAAIAHMQGLDRIVG